MDEIFDRGLAPFATHPWWIGFIVAVQENQNAVSFIPEQNPSVPTKTLFWALNTAVDLVEVPELSKKEIILSYVTAKDDGMLRFLEIFAHLGSLNPVGIKVTALIREFLNPRNGPFKQIAIRNIVRLEPAQLMFDLLEELKKEKQKTTDKEAAQAYHAITVNTIWIISAIAKKDPNFVSYVLALDKIKFIHEIIKKNFFHPKNEVHYPCLKILRLLVKVPKAAHLLAKDKFFATLKRMMELYLTAPSTKFQQVLEILVMMTRNSRAQCKRFLKAGCLVTLIRVFSYWPVWKGKGLLKMSKCCLNMFHQLASTFSGRKALIQSDALSNVRQFCENCPNDKQYDEVVTRAFAVNSLVYGKHKLPFKDISSPAKFELMGVTDKGNRESGTSSDEDDPDDVVEEKSQSPRKSKSRGEEDDDDDGENVDEEIVISDIELEEGNVGTDEEDAIKEVKAEKPRTRVPSNTPPVKKSSQPSITHEHYAQFFREMDGKLLQDPIQYYNEKSYESIVVGLLGKFISTDTYGQPIPGAEFKYTWASGRGYQIEGDISPEEIRSTYLVVSNQVRSVIPFVKVAYPEITFAYGGKKTEYTTSNTDRFSLRGRIVQLMQRAAGIGTIFKPITVYDLDSLLHNKHQTPEVKKGARPKTPLNIPVSKLGNDDEAKVGQFDRKKKHSLKFESRFEGGNLRKAIQVGEYEYDLYLMSDVNSSRHNQWFYFQVSNTPEDTPITFSIVNCIKTNSQFNYGMQPVVFSVSDALDGKPGWVRSGSNAMYYRNGYRNPGGKKRKYYYSASFTLSFAKKGDICYIAYHYPFSYSRLLTELWKITKLASERKNVLVRYDMLCHSENENEVPLVTVTALNEEGRYPVELREVIFLSSRVHPGEPNSSWVMQGILYQLIFGTGMENILQRYIFKIVPMLNVEGVINGCGRCGLTGEDLNRCWKDPDSNFHPSIFHSKGLIEYSCKIRNKTPTLYCDLHGHSRRKNVFFYGCSYQKSWSVEDQKSKEHLEEIMTLPNAMSRRSPAFALPYCKFDVRKQRETTARVVLWREFGITRSYTLESTYCGLDRGPYKGMSIGIGHLIEVGESLCEACSDLYDPPPASVSMLDIPSDRVTDIQENESKINLVNFGDSSSRYRRPELPATPSTRTKKKKMRSHRVRPSTTKSGPKSR